MSKVNFKTPYSDCNRVSIQNDLPSLTDQSFKQECDIGFIIENFVKTGQTPSSTMNFVDCTTVKSYEEAMQLVAEANTNFEKLPAKIRDEFKTVSNYLAYISDKANLKDSYERGLIDRSSVDLADVYPERFKNTVQTAEAPVENSPNNVQQNAETVVKTSDLKTEK